jgi:hypothetical protein
MGALDDLEDKIENVILEMHPQYRFCMSIIVIFGKQIWRMPVNMCSPVIA